MKLTKNITRVETSNSFIVIGLMSCFVDRCCVKKLKITITTSRSTYAQLEFCAVVIFSCCSAGEKNHSQSQMIEHRGDHVDLHFVPRLSMLEGTLPTGLLELLQALYACAVAPVVEYPSSHNTVRSRAFQFAIRIYSIRFVMRIDSFCKKSAFRFTSCHAVFALNK